MKVWISCSRSRAVNQAQTALRMSRHDPVELVDDLGAEDRLRQVLQGYESRQRAVLVGRHRDRLRRRARVRR